MDVPREEDKRLGTSHGTFFGFWWSCMFFGNESKHFVCLKWRWGKIERKKKDDNDDDDDDEEEEEEEERVWDIS